MPSSAMSAIRGESPDPVLDDTWSSSLCALISSEGQGAVFGHIASLEMLPDADALPHLICFRPISGSGGGHEARHYGDAR